MGPLPQLLPLPQLPLVPTPLPQLLPSPQLASPLPQLLEPSDTVDTLLEPDTSPVPLLPQLLLSQSQLLNTKYFPPQNMRKFKSKLGAKTLTSNLYKMKLKASKQCQRTN